MLENKSEQTLDFLLPVKKNQFNHFLADDDLTKSQL